MCSQSVRKAHDSMTSGRVYVAHGDLLDVNINRSPTAYLANPAAERAKYVTANTRARTRARTTLHLHRLLLVKTLARTPSEF